MTKYLEIKITLPLPESWAEQVKLAVKLAPAQEAFKAALEKLGVAATMTERSYVPKPRPGGAAKMYEPALFAVPMDRDDSDMPDVA